jgi:flavin reductase (DIM6/NTAB) family NADH-FMN oxidoreductase RutF
MQEKNISPSGKLQWKPGTLIYPLPAIMVSCGENEAEYNILTVSWTGTICSDPAMCYISVRKSRHSYDIIKRSGCFVLNLTTEDMAYATDWCGVRSGKDYNKFSEMKLTAEKAQKINAPIIKESPLNIECEVVEIKELGTHDMFIAKVVNIQADAKYINPKTDAFDLEAAKLLAYSHGQYYGLGRKIGKFGWSVQKKK